MATYIIGDVQGCYDPLNRLLDKIKFDPSQDKLLFCGDLVNRGGQSLKTLKLIYRLRKQASTVLGNHDISLLAQARKHPSGDSPNQEFNQIIRHSKGPKMLNWLANQPMMIHDKSQRMLLVHAGLLPAWTLKQAKQAARDIESVLAGPEQEKFLKKLYQGRHRGSRRWRGLATATNVFTRMRYCRKDGRMDLRFKGPPGGQRKGYKPWFQLTHSRNPKWTVVFGHWASLGLHVDKTYIGLDSGCVWGGKLSALRLEDRRIIQVKGLNI